MYLDLHILLAPETTCFQSLGQIFDALGRENIERLFRFSFLFSFLLGFRSGPSMGMWLLKEIAY